MNHAAESAMFWTGAMFAITPIVVAGIVIGVLWWKRRQDRRSADGSRQLG